MLRNFTGTSLDKVKKMFVSHFSLCSHAYTVYTYAAHISPLVSAGRTGHTVYKSMKCVQPKLNDVS